MYWAKIIAALALLSAFWWVATEPYRSAEALYQKQILEKQNELDDQKKATKRERDLSKIYLKDAEALKAKTEDLRGLLNAYEGCSSALIGPNVRDWVRATRSNSDPQDTDQPIDY